jgi:hypothetical protein
MKQALLAAMAFILFTTVSCNKDKDPNNLTLTPAEDSKTPDTPESRDMFDISDTQGILIYNDQGLAIADARVLIGSEESSSHSWLTPDQNGIIALPANWTSAEDVTIDAPNHVRKTLKNQMPGPMSITLKRTNQVPQLTMKGSVSGITTKDKDGWVDFSILLDSLSKNDVLNFSINKVISPWTEKVSVAGFEFPIPQNIFLPKQKESYFLTVTLQKPWFNLFYDVYGKKSVYSLQGKFPMKKMISELQNKRPYYELVNYFEFSSAGRVETDFLSSAVSPNVDTTQIKLEKTYNVKAPQIAEGQVALGISSFKENSFYQPLDIKYMGSEETLTFKTSDSTAPYFIGVVKNTTEFAGYDAAAERMSVSIQAPKSTMDTLPLMKDPNWINTNELQIDVPTLDITKYIDQGMVVVVSELHDLTLPDGKIVKYKLPVWEVHSSTWASTVTIPNIPSTNGLPKRVEVTMLATTVDNSGQQNSGNVTSSHEERIETATHLTKSARDY